MKKEYLYLGIFIILVIIAAIVFVSLDISEEPIVKDSIEIDGVIFEADTNVSLAFKDFFNKENKFTIVKTLYPRINNHIVANTGIFYVEIFTLQKLNYNSLTISRDNNTCDLLAYPKKVDIDFNMEYCNELLEEENTKYIFIENITQDLEKPKVVIEGNKLYVYSSKVGEVYENNYRFLKIVFEDLDKMIKAIDSKIGAVKGSSFLNVSQ
jgi:hypothetical protein